MHCFGAVGEVWGSLDFVFRLCTLILMTTYKILNDITGEVVDTAESYSEAVGVADYLSLTTKVLHFVPVNQEVYAV